jgi:hypothetical protein
MITAGRALRTRSEVNQVSQLGSRGFRALGCFRVSNRRIVRPYSSIISAQTSSVSSGSGMASKSNNKPDLQTIMHGSLAENPWGQAKKQSRFPSLLNDLDTDVCIVGSGIAGLTTALCLLLSGKFPRRICSCHDRNLIAANIDIFFFGVPCDTLRAE